ncbi:MAG: acetyl-CoA carboxylase biotin carboxyl carrier protein [Anaerovoracaceae bacterium]
MKSQEYFDLISRFEASSLRLLEIEEDGCRVHMEKGGLSAAEPAATCAAPQSVPAERSEEPVHNAADAALAQVKAPLVGVFYAAPSPEAPPFVLPGDRVEKGQVLCILEAMKMMNELKSPVNGILRSIGCRNGEMAEYGQILFEVEPC